MTSDEQPRWVTECGNCTIDRQFLVLKNIVARDVEEMNQHPDDIRRGYTFVTEVNDDDPTKPILAVSRYRAGSGPELLCSFMRDRHEIVVSPQQRDRFLVVVRWNEQEGACHLYLKDTETPLPLWQISQRALAPLFFGWERIS